MSDVNQSRPLLVAVAGGIGSGKSMVCKVLDAMGFLVFDCDREARLLMDGSKEIHSQLRKCIHPDAVSDDGCIDRKLISSIVFNNRGKLAQLNCIVHSAVVERLKQWATEHIKEKLLFVETAILDESGLRSVVDCAVEVVAPAEVRVERVCRRNDMTPDEVQARIESQKSPAAPDYIIDNSGIEPILPQIHSILPKLSQGVV